jgi:hypothetical protein
MPSDLSVKAVGPVLGSSGNATQPKPETLTPPATAPPAAAPVLVTNPTLRFDVAAGLVVIEFRDASGNVTTSIPSLRQLEAYQVWGRPQQEESAESTSGVHTSAITEA